MAEYEGTGWIMTRQNTARPSGQGTCCKVVMHSDFASRFPDLAARVILAHTMSIQFMYMFPYRAAEIFADNFHMPLEVSLMTLYRKLNYEGRTIRWDVNREHYQNQLDTMREYGVRPDIYDINLDGYIDLTYFNMSGAVDFDTFIREWVDPVFPLGMSFEEWRAKAVEVDGIVE
jgi:ABC-type nitrate/sulfonate/bicarbonate transport system substrate-binding protein